MTLIAVTIFASDADTVRIAPRIREALAEHGEVTSFYSDTVSVELAPSQELTARVVDELSRLNPDVGIEALFSYKLPSHLVNAQNVDRRIYNVMRSFRTMEGIPYYSASRGRMRTFFYESHVVEDRDNMEPVPDPLVDTVPDHDALTIFQRDSSFGKNILSVTYNAKEEEVLVSMTNLTTMAYRGILPVVRPGNLAMYLYVVRDGDTVYFYGNCGVATYSMFGMEERAQASFTNRIRALYSWFTDQMEQDS